MSEQPGYGSMPSTYQEPTETPRGSAPPKVALAVRLMYARVVVGIISVVITLVTISSLKDTLRKDHPNFSTSEINTVVDVAIASVLIFGAIFVALYVWLAIKINAGRNWARIVTWVLAGLGVVGFLFSLAQTQTALTRVFGVLEVILDIAIIVLLAMRESGAYFAKRV